MMGRLAIALATIGCVIGAFVLDWRAALLMIVGWWGDSILRILREAP